MILRAAYVKPDGSGGLREDDVLDAVYYAVDNGADVINMSFGGGYSERLEQALEYAVAKGVLIVSSAGNSASSEETWPAASINTIAVGAVDTFDRPALFTGCAEWVDCVAPGVKIVSATPGGGYSERNGTSVAAPFVSGLAALVKSENGELEVDEIRRTILDSCEYLRYEAGIPLACEGRGFIRADRAITGSGTREIEISRAELTAASYDDAGGCPSGGNLVLRLVLAAVPGETGPVHLDIREMSELLLPPGLVEMTVDDLSSEKLIELEFQAAVRIGSSDRVRFEVRLEAEEFEAGKRIELELQAEKDLRIAIAGIEEIDGDGDGGIDPGERVKIDVLVSASTSDVSEVTVDMSLEELTGQGEDRVIRSVELTGSRQRFFSFDVDMPSSPTGERKVFLPVRLVSEGRIEDTGLTLWVSHDGDLASGPPGCFQADPGHTGRYKPADGLSLEKSWAADLEGEGSLVCPPVMARERVLAARKEGMFNIVYAFSAVTGARLWRKELPFQTDRAPASLLAVGRLLYVTSGGYLSAVDCRDGSLVWAWSPGTNRESEVRAGEPGCSDGGDAVISTFTPLDPEKDPSICALDPGTGKVLWEKLIEGGWPGRFSPAVHSGLVFLQNDEGTILAIDVATGAEEWKVETGLVPAFPAVAAEGVVVVAEAAGRVAAVDALNGEIVWIVDIGARLEGQPCAGTGEILMISSGAGGRNVIAVRKSDGAIRSVGRIEGWGYTGIVSTGDRLLMGREEGTLVSMALADGTFKESRLVEESARVSLPFLVEERAFVCVNTNSTDRIISLARRAKATGTPGIALSNHPNPFNPGTTLSFDLPRAADVRLVIYDASGRRVRLLFEGVLGEGRQDLEWDGTNGRGQAVAAGIYFCLFDAEGDRTIRKMVLMR